jgi:hypothetical protein
MKEFGKTNALKKVQARAFGVVPRWSEKMAEEEAA